MYAAIVAGLGIYLYLRVPTSFLPDEDQGIMFVQVTAPVGATVKPNLQAVLDQVRELLHDQDEKDSVEGIFTVTGFSFGGHGTKLRPRLSSDLKDWSQTSGCRRAGSRPSRGRAMKRTSRDHSRAPWLSPLLLLPSSSWATPPVLTSSFLTAEMLATKN